MCNSFRSKCFLLFIPTATLFVGAFFLINGCDKSIENTCPLFDIKNGHVFSIEKGPPSTLTQNSYAIIAYDENFCFLMNDEYGNSVNDDTFKVGDSVTVYVSKITNHCNINNAFANSFKIAILMLATSIGLFLVTWYAFSCLSKKKKNSTSSWNREEEQNRDRNININIISDENLLLLEEGEQRRAPTQSRPVYENI